MKLVSGILVRRAVLTALLAAVLVLGTALAGAGAEDRQAELKFALDEGQVLSYKGSTTTEINFKGFLMTTVHNDKLEMSLVEDLEEGRQRVELKYIECSDRRSMGGAAMEDFDAPIKPAGRSVKAVIGPDGELVEALGFIMGLKPGRQLESYVDKWFVKLPGTAVAKRDKWTQSYPREKDEPEEDAETVYEVKGDIEFELKGFGKEKGIEVVEIESKGELTFHAESEQGVTDGTIEVEGKYKVAIDGGFLVKAETSTEMKGEMVSQELSGKETSNEVSRVTYSEIELDD